MEKKPSIITQKDVLILKQLLEDGRKSSASISKEIDLGREIVNYRIKRLVKENLIVKFIPKINEKAMHYQEYIILLKLNLDDEVSKEEFVKNTIGNKYLIWTLKSENGWDLLVKLFASSIIEFKEKLSEILELFSDVLAQYYTIITSEEIKENEKEILTRNLFEGNFTVKDFSVIKQGEIPLQIDSKDKEILKLLEQDARIQYKEIADELDISSDTVKYRIEKMKTQGIIEGFEPVINFSKMGFLQHAIIVKVQYLTKEMESKLNKFFSESKEVVRAIKSLSNDEYFIITVSKSVKEKEEFEEKLRKELSNKLESIESFLLD